MNKTLFLVSIFLLLSGCALLTPPPYNHSNAKIILDKNGDVVESQYSRVSSGFSFEGDKEDARSWIEADRRARRNKTDVQSIEAVRVAEKSLSDSDKDKEMVLNNAKREYIADGEAVGEDLPYLSGIAENASSEDAYLNFYYQDGKPFAQTFFIRSGHLQSIVLPRYGVWQSEWTANGRTTSRASFHLKRGNQIVEGDNAYGWRTRLDHFSHR